MLRLLALWPLVFLVAASPRVEHRPMRAMEVKRLTVNDAELAYVEEGAETFHCVALSRRYHYPNAWPDDGKNYSVMQHLEDVAAFMSPKRESVRAPNS